VIHSRWTGSHQLIDVFGFIGLWVDVLLQKVQSALCRCKLSTSRTSKLTASCLCCSMQLTDAGIHQAAARRCICAIRRRNRESPTTSESASFKKVSNKEDVARQNEMTTAHAYKRILHTHLLGRSNTYMRCRLAGCHAFMRVLITSHTLGLLAVRQGYNTRPSVALNLQITGRAFQNPASVVGAMAEEQKSNKVHITSNTVAGNMKDKCTLVYHLIMCAHAADIWGLEQAIQA
jgi:hypothetical protein